MVNIILGAVLDFLPAFFANASPPLVHRLDFLRPLNRPVDGGAKLGKHRVFGDGKTIGGFLFGVFAGSVAGVIMGKPLLGFLLSTGAMTGDLVGSFIKRRFGLARGVNFFPIDQTDFALVALLFSNAVRPWSPTEAVFLVLLSIPAHAIANRVAHYQFRLKKEPW